MFAFPPVFGILTPSSNKQTGNRGDWSLHHREENIMTKQLALITGSYGGLGSCFVRIHAQQGGDLVLVGRSGAKLEQQAKETQAKYGVIVHTIAVDLSLPEAARTIHDTCRKNHWNPDILINNAGFGGQGDFARGRTMEQDMAMIAVNVGTPTRLLKLFLPDMIVRGKGYVLNVSSTAAMTPGPLQAVYYATKAYVTSWSNALWRELQGTGVSVTALMPGAMATGFAKAGGLDQTKLFDHAVDPLQVAEDGYRGMLKGEINVISGLVSWQKPLMALTPLFPKKAMLDFVYDQQVAGSSQK